MSTKKSKKRKGISAAERNRREQVGYLDSLHHRESMYDSAVKRKKPGHASLKKQVQNQRTLEEQQELVDPIVKIHRMPEHPIGRDELFFRPNFLY